MNFKKLSFQKNLKKEKRGERSPSGRRHRRNVKV